MPPPIVVNSEVSAEATFGVSDSTALVEVVVGDATPPPSGRSSEVSSGSKMPVCSQSTVRVPAVGGGVQVVGLARA